MSDAPFTAIGRVVKTHGLKGEVSVVPATGLPFMLHPDVRVWMVPPPVSPHDGVIESVRSGPKGPLVKISGIDDVDAAAKLRGVSLCVRSEDLPRTVVDQIFDPVGLETHLESGESFGTVVDLIVTGANDVWVVASPVHGEVLIPVIDDVVLAVDEIARTVTLRLLPGLISDDEE